MGFEVIKELAKQKGTTLERIADHAGISYNSLSKIIRNTVKEPKYSTLNNVAKALGMSIDELNYAIEPVGLPPSLRKAPLDVTACEQKHLEKYRKLDIYGKKAVDSILDIETERIVAANKKTNPIPMEAAAEIIPIENSRRVMYYNRMASAGTGEYLFNGMIPGYVDVLLTNLSKQADFAVGVNGDSMNPDYEDGDIVLVQMQETVNIGDIGIFILNNESLIKKAGEDKLISLNPDYRDIPISEDDSLRCVGKVIGKAVVKES